MNVKTFKFLVKNDHIFEYITSKELYNSLTTNSLTNMTTNISTVPPLAYSLSNKSLLAFPKDMVL